MQNYTGEKSEGKSFVHPCPLSSFFQQFPYSQIFGQIPTFHLFTIICIIYSYGKLIYKPKVFGICYVYEHFIGFSY